jgi:hypothetical protein
MQANRRRVRLALASAASARIFAGLGSRELKLRECHPAVTLNIYQARISRPGGTQDATSFLITVASFKRHKMFKRKTAPEEITEANLSVSRPESLKGKRSAARRLSLAIPTAGVGAELQAEEHEDSETEAALRRATNSPDNSNNPGSSE